MIIWIIFGILTLVSFILSKNVESKFKKYAQISTTGHITGREVAEQMLADHRINNVSIKEVNGTLTDHYNPADRTLNLSHDVYHGTSVAAAAVAAHECGHAVQHATAYTWLGLRSMLVPATSFCSKWVSWILLAGILLINRFPQLMLVGICLFAVTTLFTIITLPVEVNASKRALVWLDTHSITSRDTHHYAVSALRSAAYTYFMAAITSLATLLYYILIYMDRR